MDIRAKLIHALLHSRKQARSAYDRNDFMNAKRHALNAQLAKIKLAFYVQQCCN